MVKKNNEEVDYSDKSKISGYSVKIRGLANLFATNMSECGDYLLKLQRELGFNNEFLKKIIVKTANILVKYIQSYFNKYCGENRIKVKILCSAYSRYPFTIRLIIPEQYRVFKMIP